MAIRSGHGATLAFGTTSTYSPDYTSLGGFSLSRESLTTTDLATTGTHTKIGGDLFDVGESTHNFLIDTETWSTTEKNSVDDLLFDSGSAAGAETITLTLVGGSSFAGSGHVTGWELQELATDTLIAASLTTQWNDMPTIADE